MMSMVSSPSSSTMAGSLVYDPLDLGQLTDYPPGARPMYTYLALIRAAILSSPTRCRTAKEIMEDIETKFPYFKTERGKQCRYFTLNTLSNTPCFSPTGSGPIQDELYWIYVPSLDSERSSSVLSSASSPASPSICTLVNPYLQPPKEEGDEWIEVEPVVEETDVELQKRVNRRAIRKEKETRTKEWTRQTHGIGEKHTLRPSTVKEEYDEELKQECKPYGSGKILKPNRPRAQSEEIVTVPPAKSSKLRKMGNNGDMDKGCCVIA